VVFLGLCSAKGSPGVTVSGLAFTLAWPGPVILAECDPAGGDLAAGFLREIPLVGHGLGPLGASLRRGRLAVDLWGHLVDLAPGAGTAMSRLVLPGFAEPGQARAWTDTPTPGGATGWQQLAALFTQLSGDSQPDGPEGPSGDLAGAGGRFDVIADCGRLTAPDAPVAVLAAADLVLLVARPTLVSVRAAAVGLEELARHGIGPVGLVMVGDGEYAPAECARQLGTRLVAALPADPATARVLSQGGRAHRGRLLRAAAHVGSALAGTPHPPVTPARRDGGRRPPGDLLPDQEHGPGPLLGCRHRGEVSDVR
jgi:hypothetical protein